MTTDTDTKPEPRTPADEDYHAETWAYAGVRIGDDGKAAHAWVDPELPGVNRLWSGRRFYRIGGLYTILTARMAEPAETEGGEPVIRLWRRGDPEYTGEVIGDPDRVAGWEARSEAAQRRLRREAAERKAKRDGGVIDEAAEGVCSLAAGAKNYDDLDLLITAVRRRMMDAWGKRSAR